MSYATIDDLRSQLSRPQADSSAYATRMMHPVPEAETVDRAAFIIDRCKGRVVLDVGASGPMHQKVAAVASKAYGWDREDSEGVTGIDLDNPDLHLPFYAEVELIVCGEVIEHLSNPGQFLRRLRTRYRGVPVIVTVPNAFSAIARTHMLKGVENVNVDHVAWYSPRTLRTLLERAGYQIQSMHWYNGAPLTAEGLVVIAG